MSVIGRLDEQVDAMLIAPLTSKRPPEEKVATVSKPERDAPDDDARQPEATENDDDQKRSAALPVWML